MAGTGARYDNSVVPGEGYQYGASLASGFGTLPLRSQGLGTSGILTGFTGTMLLAYTRAPKSMLLSNISFISATLAAGATPTLVRYGVYTVDTAGNLTLAASITNDTTIFSATSTRYTRAASGSLQIVKGQWYAVGVLIVTAAAMPSIMAAVTPTTNFPVYNLTPRIAGQVASLADLPASVTAGTVASTNILLWSELT